MSSIAVFSLVLVVILQTCEVKGSIDSFQFDVNDILNEKLMPAHLLLQELETFLKGPSNVTREHFYQQNSSLSNFTTAFTTMGFHRKMMNEYLATNFLAKQVLKELPLEYTAPIERRIGTAQVNDTAEGRDLQSNRRKGKYIQNELLEDPGSTSYRSWLDKTTTLDDIQRQFTENNNNIASNDFKPLQHDISDHRKSIENDDEAMEEEDFDDGDITGYAYSGGPIDSIPNFPQDLPPPRHHLPFDATNNIQSYLPNHPTAISKNGYYPPSGHETYNDNYGPPVQHVQHVQSVHSHPEQQTKEIGLKDILDIALTTLAFLSFGMFILQVLMCITMNKEDTSSMMMMPMEADTGAAITSNNDGTIEEIRRRKRNSPESRRIEMMNELSRRVLHSIDAVLLLPKDAGRCHYHSLCENNKYARQQKNGQKLWIPMWSLGISWLSSKVAPANATTGNSILESLKAAIVGLGNVNCTKMYGSCQMEIIADERRELEKRIKKLDLEKHFKWAG